MKGDKDENVSLVIQTHVSQLSCNRLGPLKDALPTELQCRGQSGLTWNNLFTFNLSPGYHHRPDRLQHRARAHPGGGGAEAAEAGRAVPEDGQEDARHRRLGCDPHPSTHHPHRHEDVTRLRLGFFNQLTFTNREKKHLFRGTFRHGAIRCKFYVRQHIDPHS